MPNVESGKYWDAAWNPITGCTDEYGCWARCWARAMSKHFPKLTGGDFKPRYHLKRLKTLPGGKGKVVAVCWLGDLFAEGVKREWQETVWQKMEERPEHTFLVLTKRVEEMCEFVPGREPREHIWLGASATCQADVDDTWKELLYLGDQLPCWLSLEPLLGPIKLRELFRCPNHIPNPTKQQQAAGIINCERPENSSGKCQRGFCPFGHLPIRWVVVGGETGPGARVCDPGWIRRIRDECKEHGVPLWVKQINRKCSLAELPEDLRIRDVPAGV